MNFKKEQNLINDVIGNEFEHENNKQLDNMSEEQIQLLEDDRIVINKTIEFFREKLSKDDFKKIILLQDTIFQIKTLENSFYFERGVRKAFTNLEFLKKYCECF